MPPCSSRMLWLAVCVVASEVTTADDSRSGGSNTGEGEEHTKDREKKNGAATVIFCDGVSAPVPLLRMAGPVNFKRCPALHSMALRYFALHFTALHCIALHLTGCPACALLFAPFGGEGDGGGGARA